MKLVRYGAAGREKPGVVDGEGRIRDLSGLVPDIAGEALSPKSLAKLAKVKPDKLPPVRGNPRIGPCIGRVGNSPVTYELDGRQYVLLGGGSALYAFALPQDTR